MGKTSRKTPKKVKKMKRIVVLLALLAASAIGLRAQNCEAIVLPMFNGDRAKMASCPVEKVDYHCRYSRNAFYLSDTVPEWAEMRSLSELKNKQTGKNLTEDFVVDLETLSYYAYNFSDLQCQYRETDIIICFPTPKSEHPYLVLRSVKEIDAMTMNNR